MLRGMCAHVQVFIISHLVKGSLLSLTDSTYLFIYALSIGKKKRKIYYNTQTKSLLFPRFFSRLLNLINSRSKRGIYPLSLSYIFFLYSSAQLCIVTLSKPPDCIPFKIYRRIRKDREKKKHASQGPGVLIRQYLADMCEVLCTASSRLLASRVFFFS